MSEPERALADTLAAIDGRLARIEARVASLDAASANLAAFTAAATDTLDDAARTMDENGESPADSVAEARALVAVLARPRTLVALRHSIELAMEGPRLFAALVDSIDEHAAAFGEAGVDLDARRKGLFAAFVRLSHPRTVSALTGLLDSGLLDPGALKVMGALGRSLTEAGQGRSTEIGAFGLLSVLRDPDVKRALGFAATLARRFGAATRAMKALPALAESDGDSR